MRLHPLTQLVIFAVLLGLAGVVIDASRTLAYFTNIDSLIPDPDAVGWPARYVIFASPLVEGSLYALYGVTVAIFVEVTHRVWRSLRARRLANLELPRD
jgi:hypothetical protein